MATPREHIEEIRRLKFSIGGEDNLLAEDLHHAVKHLSAELYTKDVHFLMELIQNAEDNEYPDDVEPSLEFVITTRDITGLGAPATLLVFNNEKGFSSTNIESLCSVGRSTKKNKRQGGYIGEKGIGFKSVFLVTRQPYIFSNGYKIQFNEIPPPGIKIGYIVPEWVDDKPNIEDLRKVYGDAELPNTVIILPLRTEKVEGVKEQLANIHPEVILFMSKIKKLSVREDSQNHNPRVNAVSVSQEIAFRTVKSEDSESFILHLSAEENEQSNGECSYYMWRQRFPVKAENRVEGRENIDEWVITLAFPREERVTTSNRMGAGIYAFLPTEMVTGLPFIIQADFLLVSSRESIIWGNKWNQGILESIPSAFCAAFIFLVKSVESAPPSARSYCFRYLPIDHPSYPQLARLRDEIQAKLKTEEVMLCEPENAYCMPIQARRILPAFRNLLEKASEGGLEKPSALWSTEVFIIHSCMANSRSLEFLGVEYVDDEWYSICIQTIPGWLARLSEDLYVQFLCFLAGHWTRGLPRSLNKFPLFKYDDYPNGVSWARIDISSDGSRIYFSPEAEDITWLTRWNKELGDKAQCKFIPNATQIAMKNLGHYQQSILQEWLKRYPKITELSVSSFSKQLLEEVKRSRNEKFVIRVAQFLHFSMVNNYINKTEMPALCSALPIVDDFGSIVSTSRVKLVPASIGKWAKLMGDNPWTAWGIVTLSADYLIPPPCAGGLLGGNEDDLKSFMRVGLEAVDIPDLMPPNAAFSGLSFPLEEEKAFLLLEWIHHLTANCYVSLPTVFRSSVMEGKWLKTHKGYQSPSMSFLFNSEWESAGLQLNDLSFIDTSYYSKPMAEFKSGLKQIGVVVEFGGGSEVVAKHLQMHTDFKAITRLYKYLHLFWRPRDISSIKIWIPVDGGLAGEWKDARLCVVHDDNGLFQGRLEILEKIYESTLLPYFSSILGVSLHPRIEDYCSLWLDWISSNHAVTGSECCSVWRNILKHWNHSPSTIKTHLRTPGLKLPAYTNSGYIQLSSPGKIFVPDDLSLKELFKRASPRTKFAWHPNPSDPNIPLDLLFSLYNSLGAPNISQAVQKSEVSLSSGISLRRLHAGDGLFKKGFFKIVLGYLAYRSFKLSSDKRHQIVRPLLESSFYEITEPFRVVYTLTLTSEGSEAENMEATAHSPVRWEKDNKRIVVQKSDPQNRKAKVSLATEFSDVVSKGLLSEHPDLVAALREILKMGCLLDFEDDVVNDMLQYQNFQLFKEDKSFLSQFFPETRKDSVRLNPPKRYCRGSTILEGQLSSGTPNRQIKSPQDFSPDLLEGWENRMHILKQAIHNIEDSTSTTLKTNLVRSLFPSAGSSSDIHLMKVIGDACLKMLISSELLGAHESSQTLPFKLESLHNEEILELRKGFGRAGIIDQSASTSSGAIIDECDIEMLKAIAGAASVRFYCAKD